MDTIYRITCELKNPQIITDLVNDFDFIEEIKVRNIEYYSNSITINDVVINNDDYNSRFNILSLIKEHFCRFYNVKIEDVQICNTPHEPSVPYILFYKNLKNEERNFCVIIKSEVLICKNK